MKENFDIQILVNRISELCVTTNVSVNKMLSECGLSKSIMDNLKKGSVPSVEKLLKIAEYFNVSTDYLLGKESSPTSSADMSPDDKELMDMIKSLSPEKKEMFLKFLKSL